MDIIIVLHSVHKKHWIALSHKIIFQWLTTVPVITAGGLAVNYKLSAETVSPDDESENPQDHYFSGGW